MPRTVDRIFDPQLERPWNFSDSSLFFIRISAFASWAGLGKQVHEIDHACKDAPELLASVQLSKITSNRSWNVFFHNWKGPIKRLHASLFFVSNFVIWAGVGKQVCKVVNIC